MSASASDRDIPKGRPREFDIDEALAAALRIFWSKGYEAASIADLTSEMGITKPSLYAAFGNKEALFVKALDLYQREKLGFLTTALEADTARGVAERLLQGVLEMQVSICDPTGCLIVISAATCGGESEPIKADAIRRRADYEAALVARFERAVAEGDIAAPFTAPALAHYMIAILQALALEGGSGIPHQTLRQLVETTLAVWPTR